MGTSSSRWPQRCQRCEHNELLHKKSLAEMEAIYKKKLNETRERGVKCQQCKRSDREHKESLAEMEMFYKEKLEKERSALRQLQKEMMSLKNRGERRGTIGCQRCKLWLRWRHFTNRNWRRRDLL